MITSRWPAICSTLALALWVSGCNMLKKKDDAAPAASAPAVTAAAATAAAPSAAAPAPAAAAELADDAIPASEDFEDETFAKISEQTYKTDLEALKKEIEEP
ncbi:MAG TPA: hypothetical protein VM686_05520 [Polyangiaceae bacterium]|nr:hypothetical protein [Polyangiaceae bacterium]